MQKYDLVLEGSRVLDPANSYDSVSDIGIRSGLVESVSDRISESETDRSIDVSGLWASLGKLILTPTLQVCLELSTLL